ncbi:MAG: quinolinate synthase NadA [Candidatus Omnitrophota bacterium]
MTLNYADKNRYMSIKEKIIELKKKQGAVVLAHNYQLPEIQDAADYLGDSLELSKISQSLKERVIVFCGVRFMAETAKILSPDKKVILPVEDAGCPLADTIEPGQLRELKQKYPDAWVVSYVNSSAEIKALSDVCCTSANAVKVVKNIKAKQVIFIPDKNLGWWVQKNVTDKEIILWQRGYCYVHQDFALEELGQARRDYPKAEILVHPECRKEILERADFVVSTSGMLKRVRESSAREFIIGTEEGMIYRLKKENPDKFFHSLGNLRVCKDMKKISLEDLYRALKEGIFEVELDIEVINKASIALGRMVEYV